MGGVTGVHRGGGGEGEEWEEEEAGERGGHLPRTGELLLCTRAEAEAHFREDSEGGDDGDDGDDSDDEVDQGDDKGGGVTRGVRRRVTGGLRRKGKGWVRRGVPAAGMCPRNPTTRSKVSLRVAACERGRRRQGGQSGQPG